MKKNPKARALTTSTPHLLAVLLAFTVTPAAFAQSTDEAAPAQTPAASAQPDQAPAAPTGLWDRSNLFGDMGGLRTWMGNYGVSFGLQGIQKRRDDEPLGGGVSVATASDFAPAAGGSGSGAGEDIFG